MKYRISYEDPLCHFINIEAVFDAGGKDVLELHMPAWRPGRYQLMHYARNIRKLAVADMDGKAIGYRKKTRDTWEIYTKGIDGRFVVRYDYFAADMDGGSTWLDAQQLYVNPVNCLLYDRDRMNGPCTIEVDVPEKYTIASQAQFDRGRAKFSDFWQLADAPFIASPALRHFECTIDHTVFHVWIQGHGDFDWDRFQADLMKFAGLQANIMGGFPFEAYHFLVQLLPYPHYHGVEHFNSTVITLGPSGDMADNSMYRKFLGVCSHELFHVWNVCRIRPLELMPYDFSREQYFETGFVAEGITTYYGDLLLLRSGVLDLDGYLERFNVYAKRHFANSGRFNRSLSESSVDLWLDGYGETIPGRRVSIYVKGALVAMLLDLKLIAESHGKVRLDHLMQYLWHQFGLAGKGYAKSDLLQGLYEISGKDYTDFFNRHIDGCIPLEHEFEKVLNIFGLNLTVAHSSDALARFLGMKTTKEGNVLSVAQVAPLSPAYGKVCSKDRILKIDSNPPREWDGEFKVPQSGSVLMELDRNGERHTLNLKKSSVSFYSTFELTRVETVGPKEESMQKIWSGTA